MSSLLSARLKRLGCWHCAALLAWSAALAGIAIHRSAGHSRTTLEVYQLAGHRWLHGGYLYADWRGFVYSPLAAAFFASFEFFPRSVATVFWLAVNSAALLGGTWAVLRAGLFPSIRPQYFGAVFLLLLPLAVGNLDVMQANPLVIGLLLLAAAAVARDRWSVAAASVAVTFYLKIYPLALGLLIVLLAPKRFGWRLLLALASLGLLPFLFQHWDYVRDQYHFWIAGRLGDNRLQYSEKDAPLDLWFLLVRLGGLPLTSGAYRALQILAGGAIALYEVAAIRRGWPRERILAGAFCFVSVWMTLFGPATESYTYILLAPAAALAVADSFSQPRSLGMRAAASLAFALLLAAVARNSFFPHLRPPWLAAFQPLGAVFFLGWCLGVLRKNELPRSFPAPGGHADK